MLQSTSDSLQLDKSVEIEEFFMDGFHDLKQIKARSVELTIHPLGNLSGQFLVKRNYVLEMLNLEDDQPDKINSICSSYDYLKDINFPNFDKNQVSILIGTDNFDLLLLKQK